MQKTIAWLGYIGVTAVIVCAFLFIGSPVRNAALHTDEQRLSLADDLHCRLTRYYYKKGKLPADLSTAYHEYNLESDEADCNEPYSPPYISYDKESPSKDEQLLAVMQGAFYDYTPVTKTSYKACTPLEGDWQGFSQRLSRHDQERYSWAKNYTAGVYCFTRTIFPARKKERH